MTIAHVVVAIPARDEAELLPTCLRSVTRAIEGLHRTPRSACCPTVEVVVALDGCTDDSGRIAAEFGATCVEVPSVGVGAARDAAIRTGLARTTARRETVWIANTDADSCVPEHWLTTQTAHAAAGYDLVVGTVEPMGVVDPALLAAWHDRHVLEEDHTYVHGANLGVRASAYLRIGGFRPERLHEDVHLVAAARARGCAVLATDTTRVATSGRLVGRVRDGFTSYLQDLCDAQESAVMGAAEPAETPALPSGAV